MEIRYVDPAVIKVKLNYLDKSLTSIGGVSILHMTYYVCGKHAISMSSYLHLLYEKFVHDRS